MQHNIHDDEKGIEFIEIRHDEFPENVAGQSDTDDGRCQDGHLPVLHEENDDESGEEKKKKNTKKEILSYVAVVVSALVIAFAVNHFVLLNARVPSSSMVPVFEKGDRFIGLRLAYLFNDPERGDIVVFKHKCYEGEGKTTLVKRIIGLPGDEISISGGHVFINGEILEESYITEPVKGEFGPFKVPDGSYFMMGDNRNVSDDARYWDNKYVPREEIIAKAWFRYRFEVNKV